MYVGNIRNARDYARTIAVAQTALYGVTLVQFRIDGIDLCDVVVQGKLMVFHGYSFQLRD